MTVGIHQPNFLPWLGYFHKIINSDKFVLLDDVQFVKGSICNRNKIKNNQGQEVWITVSVKGDKGSTVNFNDLPLDYDQKWPIKILNQLQAAYIKAPFYQKYIGDLKELLVTRYSTLAELNIVLIKYLCSTLNITTPLYVSSELNQEFGKKNNLNINISKYFGADVYLSGTGAKKYNDEELFKEAGLEIKYTEFKHPVYPQLFGEFVPNLSVIDLLFNCGDESLNILLGRS